MNVKVGLPIWHAPKPKALDKNVMIIGADVHHKTGKMSTIGFVASMNDKISQYMFNGWVKLLADAMRILKHEVPEAVVEIAMLALPRAGSVCFLFCESGSLRPLYFSEFNKIFI